MKTYQNNDVKFLSVIYILESDVKCNIIINTVKFVSLNIAHQATIHPIITHFSPQLGLDNVHTKKPILVATDKINANSVR
jgi:hypothetical protein